MAEAAQPKDEPEESPLSPWRVRSALIALVFGFAALLAITLLAYRNAPPIPGQVKDASGTTLFTARLFTASDIRNGQALLVLCQWPSLRSGAISACAQRDDPAIQR